MKWMLKTPRGVELEEALFLAEKSGYDGAEIQLYDLPDGEEWKRDFIQTVREFGRKGFLAAVHAPSGDLNLSSSNQGIRKESLRQVLDTIELAKDAGAVAVTVHPGRLSSIREKRERQYEWMKEALWEISMLAEQKKIVVGLENMENRPKEVFTFLRELNRLLDSCRNPFLGVTLDFAHLQTVDPELDLLTLTHPVVNVHVSQCVNGVPHHSLTAEGDLPLSRCLSMLTDRGYAGTVVVEAKDNVTEAGARENLEVLCRAYEGSEKVRI